MQGTDNIFLKIYKNNNQSFLFCEDWGGWEYEFKIIWRESTFQSHFLKYRCSCKPLSFFFCIFSQGLHSATVFLHRPTPSEPLQIVIGDTLGSIYSLHWFHPSILYQKESSIETAFPIPELVVHDGFPGVRDVSSDDFDRSSVSSRGKSVSTRVTKGSSISGRYHTNQADYAKEMGQLINTLARAGMLREFGLI